MAGGNGYMKSSYSHQANSSNIFYESEVKKDSEIQLRKTEVQQYLQTRDTATSQHSHSLQQQLHHHQQQQQNQQEFHDKPTLEYDEGVAISPDKGAAVTSLTQDTSLNISDCSDVSPSDASRLSQSDRTHLCQICFKGFRNKPQLTQHELVHNNVRKHVCSYCEKSFKQVCHLNQHIRVHTGDRPYKCDVEGCGRSFAQLSNLNHHKKNHEEHVRRDIARQFRCEVCDRSYATKNSLNTHIHKLHSNLKAMEGSVEHPMQMSAVPSPRKRKKKSELAEYSSEPDEEIQESFVMECDSDNDDDDLPTQVKVRSKFGLKSNLTVRIGTPSGNSDRDKNSQVPRTTLPLPYSTAQSQLLFEGQGQDSYIDYTETLTSQAPGGRDMLSSRLPPNLFPSNNVRTSHEDNQSLHDNRSFHVAHSEVEHSAGLEDEHTLIEAIKHNEAMMAKQRELMQTTQRVPISRSKPAFNASQLCSSLSTTSMSSSPHTAHSSQAPPEDLSLYSKPNRPARQGQITQGGITSDNPLHAAHPDNPSHVTHHFPKANTSEQNQRISSHQIFNPAFDKLNQSSRLDRFSQIESNRSDKYNQNRSERSEHYNPNQANRPDRYNPNQYSLN